MKELKTLRAVQQNIRSSCAEEICLHMVSRMKCSVLDDGWIDLSRNVTNLIEYVIFKVLYGELALGHVSTGSEIK